MQNLINSIILFNKSNDDFVIHYFLKGDILYLYIYDLCNDKFWHLESHYNKKYSIKELLIFLNKLCYGLRGDEE